MKLNFNNIIKSFSGSSNVVISNNRIIVNGKEIMDKAEGIVKIDVEGDIVSLDVAGDTTINGNILKDANIVGDLKCNDIGGDILSCVGDIDCENIGGDIESCVGSVSMKR